MAGPAGPTQSNAATRVFGITELLEAILEHVRSADAAETFFNGHHFQHAPCKALVILRGVNRAFEACIERSTLFQKHTWIGDDDKIVPNPTYASIPAVLINRKRQIMVTQAAHIAPLLWFVSQQLGCSITKLDFDEVTKTFTMRFTFDTTSKQDFSNHAMSWENMRAVRGPPGIKARMVMTVVFDNKGKSGRYMKALELLIRDANLGDCFQAMREIHGYSWSEHLAHRDLDTSSAERAKTRRGYSDLLRRAALQGGWRLDEVDKISESEGYVVRQLGLSGLV